MSNFKVSITGPNPRPKSNEDITIVFDASSPVSESRSANYSDGYNIVHLPTDILAYRNTSGRKFGVTAKLVSRTKDEAVKNAWNLNCIRSWMLPDFGDSGATPPILYFSAYNSLNIKNLSSVIRNYSWTFPDDVDFIFSEDEPNFEPMPIIGTVQFEIDEIWSAKEITEKLWKIKAPEPFSDGKIYGSEYGGPLSSSNSMYYNFGYRDKYRFPGVAKSLFGIPGLPSVGQILNTGASVLEGAVSGIGKSIGIGIGGILKSGSSNSNSNLISDATKIIDQNAFLNGPADNFNSTISEALNPVPTLPNSETVTTEFNRNETLLPDNTTFDRDEDII